MNDISLGERPMRIKEIPMTDPKHSRFDDEFNIKIRSVGHERDG